MRTLIHAAAALAALGVAAAATASGTGSDEAGREPTADTLLGALEQGSLDVDLRYRLEFVDDAAFDKDALASTLRGALTYETATFRGLFAGITFETVTAIGNGELYNNRGFGDRDNGVTDRPVVADPEIIEVDRLFLGYRGPSGLELRAGRFDYVLDNQRFIGTAAWRQNHRSFDGLWVAIGSPTTLLARYAYVGRVHYNTGRSPDIDAHLVHLSREVGPGSLSGYAYLLDWGATDRAPLSSGTYGVRYTGDSRLRSLGLLYFGEYARQLDHGDNPRDFSLHYVHVGLGARSGPWTLQAGWELKDGDGVSAVQTPLGTNHGKNGFADRLVATPPDGSHDRYVRLSMDRNRWSWLVAYHDFQAAQGGDRLGAEVDFQGRYTPVEPLSIFLKVAHYTADTLSTDVTKVMLWASWSFGTTFH